MQKTFGDMLAIFTAILTTIIAVVLVPLNLLGAIVSGVWLGILGDWHAIIQGLIFIFCGTWILAFPLMATLVVSLPAVYFLEKNKFFYAAPFLLLSVICTYGIIVISCMAVFNLLLEDETSKNIFPLLLWSFGVVTSPWTYMASKENNEGSTIAAIFTQLGFLGTIIAYGLFDFSFKESIVPLIAILSIGVALQFIMVVEEKLRARKLEKLYEQISSSES